MSSSSLSVSGDDDIYVAETVECYELSFNKTHLNVTC